MATTIFTPSMLRGAGTRGVPEIPVGSSFTNTYSMKFDGVDEAIQIPTLSTTANYTIAFWAKLDSSTIGSAYILAQDNPGSQNQIYFNSSETFYFKGAGTTVNLQVDGTGGVPFSLDDGAWHHFAFTKTGTTLTWWFDGQNPDTPTGTVGAGGFVLDWIGNAWTSNHYINGNMDELAIWNSDQASNMSTIYNDGTPGDLSGLSPLLWLRMGDDATWDGSDWTLTDQGSSGNDGTSDNMDLEDRVADVPS